MRISFGLRMLAVAAGLALPLPTTVLAATFDMQDLLAPPIPVAPEAVTLPPLTATLDAAARQSLATALTRIDAGDFLTAEAEARKVTGTHPEAPEGWYVLGIALDGLGRSEEALAALDRAAAGYTVNATPLVQKGDILLSLDRRDEAVAAWQAAVERDPSNWRAQERLAALAETQGDRKAALRYYETSIAQGDDTRLYPRLQAARLSLLLGDPARAEALLTPEAGKDAADDVVLDYLSRAKIGLDKLDEADALLERLIARGTSARPYVTRAQLYVAEGRAEEAVQTMARGAAAFADDPQVLLEQGRILGATGRYQEALVSLSAGLALRPEDPALLRAASLAEQRLGQLEAALAHARALAALPGASVSDLTWLAALQEGSGAMDAAAATYRLALEKDPQNWVALNNLASLLASSAPDEAVQLAQRAAALAPDSAAVRDTLGWAQLQAGQLEPAARIFEALHAADPDSALAAYRLGIARLQQGRTEDGRALLQQALQLDPAFRYADDARKRLQ